MKLSFGKESVVCGIVHQSLKHGIVSSTNPPDEKRGEPDDIDGLVGKDESCNAQPIGKDGKEVQPSPLEFYAESDRWYKNQGDGSFKVLPISRENARPGTSLGLIITNFDHTNA